MIAMSIVFLVSMSLYAPYGHYQNKAHLKLGAKQIQQFLAQARNSAVYGSASGSNLSFGLYVDTGLETKISLLSYPFDVENSNISRLLSWDDSKVQNLALEPWVVIDSIGGVDNMLLFFQSISGELSLYSWDQDWLRQSLDEDSVEIKISYKWSSSSNLQQTLTYYTKTYVTDY